MKLWLTCCEAREIASLMEGNFKSGIKRGKDKEEETEEQAEGSRKHMIEGLPGVKEQDKSCVSGVLFLARDTAQLSAFPIFSLTPARSTQASKNTAAKGGRQSLAYDACLSIRPGGRRADEIRATEQEHSFFTRPQ